MTQSQPPDLAELAAAAKEATPGPWVEIDGYYGGRSLAIIRSVSETLTVGLPENGSPWVDARANRRYIAAADPTTIVALIEERDRYREALTEAQRSAADAHGDDRVLRGNLAFIERLARAALGGES